MGVPVASFEEVGLHVVLVILTHYQKTAADNQADLYGLFWERAEKRVQIYLVEERETRTWQQKVDRKRAKTLLENFRRLHRGELAGAADVLAPNHYTGTDVSMSTVVVNGSGK